jgi:hypothetical protein
MIFNNETDYLCYVEAVELLRIENRIENCDFIYNPKVLFRDMNSHIFDDETFLKLTHKSKEHFFVIDNTDYPEAMLDEDWTLKKPSSE